MRIKSAFRDYYDSGVAQFGVPAETMVDETVTYIRGKIEFTDAAKRLLANANYFRFTLTEEAQQHGEVSFIVAGRYVFSVWQAFHGDTQVPAADTHFVHNRHIDGRPKLPIEDELHELIVAVGAPVFRVTCDYDYYRIERTPILADYGISKLVSPKDMWLSIYETLTGVLRPNPDKKPPVVVDNYHKIWAAGHDPKTSFRNPINPMPKKKR